VVPVGGRRRGREGGEETVGLVDGDGDRASLLLLIRA